MTDKTLNTNKKTTRIFLADKYVCNYISSEWIDSNVSDRTHAKLFGIHHNIIGKIKLENGYQIPVSTLSTICFNKGVSIAEFFTAVTLKYGEVINDSFIELKKT